MQLFFTVLIGLVFVAQVSGQVRLTNDVAAVTCDPSSLKLDITPTGQATLRLSDSQRDLGAVRHLVSTSQTAQWDYAESETHVTLRLDGMRLHFQVKATHPGNFTFPVLFAGNNVKGWILPLFEGVYVPNGDERWAAYLAGRGEMNTTADLTMPFLGLDTGAATVTCILTNPFNNHLSFGTNAAGQTTARLTHQFTPNNAVKEFGVLFQVGKTSPVEPAKIYREWLIARGEFLSLAQKIKRTPETEKLLGAAHIYLWGEDLLDHDDILNWKRFAQALQTAAATSNPSPAHHIGRNLGPEARQAVTNIAGAESPDKYTKSLLLADINALLLKRGFYDPSSFADLKAAPDVEVLREKDPSTLSQGEVCRLNTGLFSAAFPGMLAHPKIWGGGVSPRMVEELAAAGLDRLWLGSGGWSGFVNRPETVEAARRHGFLVGPYDSYHSIHHPSEPDTWDTAQFGLELYETGGIVNADGSKRHGFKKKGYLLSPAAARPYVEKRVSSLMKQFKANSWFVDCDGFGEFFDDFSPAHPATHVSDLQARLSRMAWIRDTFGAVVGTEGCFAGVASTVHFSHGVTTPVIGWGDPNLKDKKSKYYLGAYYPPGEPAVFFKPVPIKDEYRYIYYDPRFRLPLFQTVFHDSVVATHHWTNPSLKFPEVAPTVQLLELLYNVPPLYHLSLSEFQKRKAYIKRHYAFFSSLHRELALLPMTDFQWLNVERTVQKTVFDNKVEIIANFGKEPFKAKTLEVAPQSLAVIRNGDSAKIIRWEAQ